MADTEFKLATVSIAGSPRFVVLALGARAVALDAANRAYEATGARTRLAAGSMLELLADWPASFDALQEVAAFVAKQGFDDPRWKDATAPVGALRFHAPVVRPPAMYFAAVNYPRPGRPGRDPSVPARPYMFEKTARCAVGPYDDVVKPRGYDEIDYEVELALVIGTGGRRIPAERAMEHVAGFLVANDVTCRNFRQKGELPIPGPDWFGSKCHDGFAPLGPYLVPRPFVPDCRNLRLTLKINGETFQDGNTRDMVFSPEEQVAHVSNQITLEPGDVFSTGTPEGLGMLSGRYLKPGDVFEAAIEGLGAQRNRLVAEDA